MQLYKRYINVITLIEKDGNLRPLSIIWDNDVQYEIDRIIEIRKAHSQVGGAGILYRCQIQGQIRNLFFERNRWFIESYHP